MTSQCSDARFAFALSPEAKMVLDREAGGRMSAAFWMYAMALTVVLSTLTAVLCACRHRQNKYALLSQTDGGYGSL